jgi:hypothetical protein
MIHIVFNEADVQVLQEAVQLDESINGPVLLIRDDYAVGPLGAIYTQEGAAARNEWWRTVVTGGDYESNFEKGLVNDAAVVAQLLEKLQSDETEILWIWAAQNKHDVCGYYWLVSQLKDYQGRVFILYLNNLPFINEKGNIFYPTWLSQIPAKEFLKAKKLARPVTLSEFEVDPDEWRKLCEENKMVRLLEGGKKLVQADEDYYDNELKKYITADWQKASKIINQMLSKSKETTGDAYLLWRLKTLLTSGYYDVQGEQKNMKDFEVKLPSGKLEFEEQ